MALPSRRLAGGAGAPAGPLATPTLPALSNAALPPSSPFRRPPNATAAPAAGVRAAQSPPIPTHLRWMQEQHRNVMESLYREVQALKAENKELKFRVVMSHSGKVAQGDGTETLRSQLQQAVEANEELERQLHAERGKRIRLAQLNDSQEEVLSRLRQQLEMHRIGLESHQPRMRRRGSDTSSRTGTDILRMSQSRTGSLRRRERSDLLASPKPQLGVGTGAGGGGSDGGHVVLPALTRSVGSHHTASRLRKPRVLRHSTRALK